MSDDDERRTQGGEEENDQQLVDAWKIAASEEDELADRLNRLHDIDMMILEMKDISELSIDLAYSALLYDSVDIAEEVDELEGILDNLHRRVQRRALVALERGEIQVDQALTLIRLASAAEVISDGALQIADVVLRDMELHPVLAATIRESDVNITRGRIHEGSMLVGKTLGQVKLESETGMRAIAIKRGATWIYGPDSKADLWADDIIVARGPREGEKDFLAALRGELQDWDEAE